MEKDNEKASALQRMQSAIRAINRMDLPDEEKARRIQGVMRSMSARSREPSTGRSSGTSEEEGEGSVAWKTYRVRSLCHIHRAWRLLWLVVGLRSLRESQTRDMR